MTQHKKNTLTHDRHKLVYFFFTRLLNGKVHDFKSLSGELKRSRPTPSDVRMYANRLVFLTICSLTDDKRGAEGGGAMVNVY